MANKKASQPEEIKLKEKRTISLEAVKTVQVKAKHKNGFRRAGIKFTHDFQEVDVSRLTDEHRKNLQREINLGSASNLIVETLSE